MKPEQKKRIWQDYQKEIPDNHYFYVRSCIRQSFFPGSETVLLNILQNELDKDIFEDENHTTCTGIGYHTDVVPFDTTMTVVARQFALMTEKGYENITISCVTSFGLYTEILETWKHFPEVEKKVRDLLYKATGRTFNLPKHIAHASDIIYKMKEAIAQKAKHKLINIKTGKPLRVVEHIGCHYAKMFPNKGVGGAEFPSVLTGMIESWGGEVIDYPERRHCCGFGFRQYLVLSNRGYSVANSQKKFESMEPFEPDFIVANCPGCAMFLDKWQYTISEMEGKVYSKDGYGIPVLTYEEMAGLVLGYKPWDLGLQLHQVSCEKLLDKMGIHYNMQEKYLGSNGKPLGKPDKPNVLKVLTD
jgi:heterodisulfide reductase subunit B